MSRSGSPAEQVARDLVKMRDVGLGFDKAWSVAVARCRWPHDTVHRRAWKAILSAQREPWREAFERRETPARRFADLAA